MNDQNKTGNGPLIASIIIVLVIILGGIFSFTKRPLKPETAEDLMKQEDTALTQLSTQSDSTDLESIETDAANTNLDTVDSDLQQLDTELDSLIQGL